MQLLLCNLQAHQRACRVWKLLKHLFVCHKHLLLNVLNVGDHSFTQPARSFAAIGAAVRAITQGKYRRVLVDGKGIKPLRQSEHGDLMVHVVVETPVKLTTRQKEILREFDESTQADSGKHSPKSKSWLDKAKGFFE